MSKSIRALDFTELTILVFKKKKKYKEHKQY